MNTQQDTKDSPPNKAEWAAEIHRPDQTYNANVPIDLIERDPGNRVPAEADVEALAKSIGAVGLLQPIVLRRIDGSKYRIVAGETRWRAFQILERETIPAFIRTEETDLGAAQRRLVENMQRTDLTPVQRARQFAELSKPPHSMKQKEIGALVGKSQPVVANAIRMLSLPESVLELIESGKLPEAVGVSLARFARWPRVVEWMAKNIGAYGYTAKRLDAEKVPMYRYLDDAGLVRLIKTRKSWSEDTDRVYRVPDALMKSPDFVEIDTGVVCYFLPENGPDLWGQEKITQDEVFDRKERAKAQQKAAQIKSGKLTKEQIEVREAKERTKAVRQEIAAALNIAVDKLRRAVEPAPAMVSIIVTEAIAGGYSAQRITLAAESVGVKLPQGLVSDQGGQGLREVEAMAKMPLMDLLRLACGVIISKESDEYHRNAGQRGWSGGVPRSLELIGNLVVPTAAEPVKSVEELAADANRVLFTREDASGSSAIVVEGDGAARRVRRSAITPELKEQVKARVCAGKTGAEIAHEFGISLPSVQNIKKELGLIKPRGTGHVTAEEWRAA